VVQANLAIIAYLNTYRVSTPYYRYTPQSSFLCKPEMSGKTGNES